MTHDPTASGTPSTDDGAPTPESLILTSVRSTFGRQRALAERALSQVDDAAFFTVAGDDANSLAVLAQHIGGNLRSRFTDFLTSDGEKPDRHRDQEFEIGDDADRDEILVRWARGWGCLEESLAALEAGDLTRTVTIRSEPYSVVEALLRALDHIAYHVGQIVLLARDHCGTSWQTLSVPRGGSQAYADAVRRGEVSQRQVRIGRET